MSKSSNLEWVQCRQCGRRQRWKAELAGSEVDCPCGRKVFFPRPEEQAKHLGTGFDADETLVDPDLTNEAAAINEGLPRTEQESLLLEEESKLTAAQRAKLKRLRAKGKLDMHGSEGIINYSQRRPLAGMSRPQNLLFWLSMMLLTFAVIMMGAMNVNYYVLGAGGVMLIVTLVKIRPAYRLWRGNRSFKRAWMETFTTESERGADLIEPSAPAADPEVEKTNWDSSSS